jgi:hypothetical protein
LIGKGEIGSSCEGDSCFYDGTWTGEEEFVCGLDGADVEGSEGQTPRGGTSEEGFAEVCRSMFGDDGAPKGFGGFGIEGFPCGAEGVVVGDGA